MVFDCYGEDANCIGETWSKFYKEFLPQTGYMATDSTDFEIYLEDGQDGLFCQLWIPIKKM
ncbi:MAG: GyrI-like domain-containing protein [Bacteroidales bacterium]|nr:GyrI-like domain-containing protein [Bacteroidales bacterium]